MTAAGTGTKRRWLASALGAAVVMATLLALFRSPRVAYHGVATRPAKPPVALTPGRPDELAMRDLAPLFLPTRYNASASVVTPREPGAEYFERDPGRHALFDQDRAELHLPLPMSAPGSPVEALVEPPPPLAAGIGRTDMVVPPLPPSAGHLDVFAGDSRDSILGVTLGPDAALPGTAKGSPAWKPVEFLAAVDVGGLVGPLLLTNGSGVEEVDNHFRNYLARTWRIGDRLPPGFYRIVVGP